MQGLSSSCRAVLGVSPEMSQVFTETHGTHLRSFVELSVHR